MFLRTKEKKQKHKHCLQPWQYRFSVAKKKKEKIFDKQRNDAGCRQFKALKMKNINVTNKHKNDPIYVNYEFSNSPFRKFLPR